ncbi:hypothetical protein M408DRAFT_332890 [Serendipita vermifera MAFF 305830]|uniref:Uncharacterized protein n=1 Tax=Serendipita vermifera MAFF 305830 TaxID=933852 RepID=A0A0C3AR34_SERVB|nr:hypothetical protein M408DRAFT_332890 [Serendipita vermifera MAFF 305830]
MSKVLIVDDANSGIAYNGSWTTQAFVWANSNEYASTVHRAGAAGDQLSYTFFGTGISVYGTIDTPSTKGLPSATFSIDGAPSTALNSTGSLVIDNRGIVTSHVLLYKSTSLAKGSHTITVKTGTPANATAQFYFDYFAVSTGSDSTSGDVLVDDRDSSIVYSGPWVDNGISAEYLGTTRQSPGTANGGTATFRFNGTGITVIGTTAQSSGASSVAQIGFDIDGVRNNTFTGPENAQAILHTPFFQVSGLANDKEHTITMNTLTPNVWFLDFMVYKTENSAIAGGGPAPGASGGGGSGPSTGAIAGGVIAAVIGVLAIAGIIFIFIRRRRMSCEDDSDQERVQGGTPRPFPVPLSSTEGHSQGHPEMSTFNPFISNGSHGNLPASKGGRSVANGSSQGVVRPASSSYIGGGSSAYSGMAPEESQYDSSLPSPPLNASPPGRNNAHGTHTYNNPLYPQFDAGSAAGGGGRARDQASTHMTSSHNGDTSNYEGTPNEKARFMHAQNRAMATQQTAAPSTLSPTTIEEDSGIRIPAVSPPIYTAD